MPRDAEIAFARSAAPERISSPATVKVLTAAGYEIAAEGTNGFICMVMRGWAAFVGDDEGTPFALVVVPVDGNAQIVPKTISTRRGSASAP